ncbi:MAG: hypothetical protein V7K18_19080 [Nostoc sp.]|uniref:hypothetical protein n=1 Tax=Nostoc sp. TaxID=1180 RepID=UPI002FF54B0B
MYDQGLTLLNPHYAKAVSAYQNVAITQEMLWSGGSAVKAVKEGIQYYLKKLVGAQGLAPLLTDK